MERSERISEAVGLTGMYRHSLPCGARNILQALSKINKWFYPLRNLSGTKRIMSVPILLFQKIFLILLHCSIFLFWLWKSLLRKISLLCGL